MLSLRIAFRYLLSRKSHGAVNIISAISLAAIAVAAAAMVIVLSVFNGFTQLAESKLSSLDPDFMLTPTEGKTINCIDSLAMAFSSIDGVAVATPEITEQAFAVAAGRQMPVTIKGMTADGLKHSGISRIIVDGTDSLDYNSALLSVGVAINLNLRPSVGIDSLTIYEPRRIGRINPANPFGAFRRQALAATGVYQVEQEEYDRDMAIIPFNLAERLLSYSGQATSLAIYLASDADAKAVENRLSAPAEAAGLVVKDRHKQQEQAFRMISIEKWITFIMLAFILTIASFNIISTLSMMIIEKEPNMNILSAMGATRRMLSSVFIWQGWLIVVLGGIAGMIVGALLVLCQQHFGLIKLSASDPSLMSVDVYPVLLRIADLAVTFATVVVVALFITPIIYVERSRKL